MIMTYEVVSPGGLSSLSITFGRSKMSGDDGGELEARELDEDEA